jgi:single-strand DNA-binding protein
LAWPHFRLAVTPRVKDPGGRWRDGETSFIPVNVWRDTAENVAESDIGKGTRVVVTGRLRTRSWQTDTGDRRTITELEADEVAPSLRFHQVRQIVKAERTRTSGRERDPASRADGIDEPPF